MAAVRLSNSDTSSRQPEARQHAAKAGTRRAKRRRKGNSTVANDHHRGMHGLDVVLPLSVHTRQRPVQPSARTIQGGMQRNVSRPLSHLFTPILEILQA